MGSHAQDSKTAKAASTGAQAQDQTLSQNAAKNQQFADQTRQNLFGTYQGGKYSGGLLSQYLDPNLPNQSGLSGSYLQNYNNAANHVAQNTQNAVGTTLESLRSRGLGKTPAGFEADQMRKAYQDQAGQLGDLYSTAAQAQHAENQNNFMNAANMLNSNAGQTANLSLQGNQAAASNYANLYGTGSQQVQSGWATALGTIGQLGSAAGQAYGAYKHG